MSLELLDGATIVHETTSISSHKPSITRIWFVSFASACKKSQDFLRKQKESADMLASVAEYQAPHSSGT
jgi:hypothetical protein